MAEEQGEYYILSLKWSTSDELVWYKPESKGYTKYLSKAGRFTTNEAQAHGMNGITVAIHISSVAQYEETIVPPECKAALLRIEELRSKGNTNGK